MACSCTSYTCLNIVQQYSNCLSTVTLDLVAGATGTYTWRYEFNGTWKGGNIDVTESAKIVLPYVFNENYTHIIEIYKGDGTLLNDTCYTLDTSRIVGSYATATVETPNYLNVTVTDDMLSDNNTTITLNTIDDRSIVFIADGNQLYNFASFTQSGNSFTMTNGAAFYVGQKITIQLS